MEVTSSEVVSNRLTSPGAGRRLRARIGEHLFSKWYLYLAVLLLCLGIGVYKATGVQKTYVSAGTINVASATFLSDLTNVNVPSFGYQTPAQKTANDINQRLGTDEFASKVAEAAGATGATATDPNVLAAIRRGVLVYTGGASIVRIAATTGNGELSQQLANAVISTYTDYVVDVETADSTAAAAFYQDRLKADQATLDDAKAAVNEFLESHPQPAIGARPDTEAIQLKSLTDATDKAQQAVDDDNDKIQQADLATAQSKADINQRLTVVDQPQAPIAPQPIRKDQAMTVVIFLAVGIIVALTFLLVVSLMDRTIRSSLDLSDLPGLSIAAVIPALQSNQTRVKLIGPTIAGELPKGQAS